MDKKDSVDEPEEKKVRVDESADPSSPVFAIRNYDVVTLKRLVAEGVSMDYRDEKGYTLLHEAATWNSTECLKFLIQIGIYFFSL